MPILQAFGPSAATAPVPNLEPGSEPGAAARRHGVLPMPSLEWNEQVARETAPLYARVQKVVPAVEWPFFAPFV
jgi:quinolinate synthase